VNCRDPTKCWRCKRPGHSSLSCPSHKGASHKLAIPHCSLTRPPPRIPMNPHSSVSMEHHRSWAPAQLVARARVLAGGPQGSGVNYPCNPRFHPWVAFKIANTSDEMEQRRILLTNHALVIVEVRALVMQSREEVKNLISRHFGVRKHELYVYHSQIEGPKKATKGGMNKSQSKFITATWPISRKQPDALSSNSAKAA
jgi:hypothetical protein